MQPRITADNIKDFHCQETATLDLSEKVKKYSHLTIPEAKIIVHYLQQHKDKPITHLNLSHLIITHEAITTLLDELKSLNTLIMRNTILDINLVCKQLANCPTLQSLDLIHTAIEIRGNHENFPEPILLTGWSFFTLIQSKSITRLNLTGNLPIRHDDEGQTNGEILGELIEKDMIKELILDTNHFGDAGALILSKGKFNLLSVADCSIGVPGAKALIKNTHFKSLNLGLNTKGLFDQEFLNLVVKNDTLIELDLSRSGINTNCCTIIAKNETLKRLILRFNQFGAGLIAFKNHPSLIYLDVQSNHITDDHGYKFFTDNIMLQGIDLADNSVGDNTAAAVGSNIKVINISYNFLTMKGVEILLGKKHLKNLLIKNNSVIKKIYAQYKGVLCSLDPHVRWKYAEGGSSLFALAAHKLTDKDKEKLEKEEQYKTLSEEIKKKMAHL